MDFDPLPVTHQATILEEYLDENQHLNVMWYVHLFDQATLGFFTSLGMGMDYRLHSGYSTFALEQHIRYLAELRLGERVTLRTRALARSAKRLHFMHFMLRQADGALAATTELVGTHVDMKVRRSHSLPPGVAQAFDRAQAAHRRLDWEAPVCGVMGP